MRSLFFAACLVFFMSLSGIVCAEGARERKEQEMQLFNKAVNRCINEVYAAQAYSSENDESMIEACLARKGVSLKSDYLEAEEGPKAHHMGGQSQKRPKSLTYEIGDKDALIRNLQGGGREAVQPEMEYDDSHHNETEPPVYQKAPSPHNKYYLPSNRDKSGGGAKPIFLNR